LGSAFDETSLAQIPLGSLHQVFDVCNREKEAEENLLGSRFIAGKIELVVPATPILPHRRLLLLASPITACQP